MDRPSAKQSEKPVRGRGRPRDPAKLAAIIAAADRLLLSVGYARLTMEAVAEAASVSKMTVYAYFPGKAALLSAVARAATERLLASIPSAAARPGTPLEATLVPFGLAFLSLVLRHEVVAVGQELRLASAEDPQLAALFYEAGPGQTRSALAGLLATAAAEGRLRLHDSLEAADDLLGLWLGDVQNRMLMGVMSAPGPEELRHRAVHGVEVFLRAYAPCADVTKMF